MVNIITPTLKAHISHEEKLNFCNYPIIKPLLNKSREPKPFIFKCQSGSTAVTIPAQKGARQGLVIPSLETQNITAQIWVSVPLLVGLLLDHLCTAALPEKKIQPLHLLNKVGRKKKETTLIFKASTQRIQSSEHKTAGGAGFVLPLPVGYGKQENSAPFALCTIPVHPPGHRRVTSTQAFRRERKSISVG